MKKNASKLTDNPFYILGADYNASASELSALVEDVEIDGTFSSDVLHRVQQALVTPRTRLLAELSWLPELSGAQVRKVFALLENGDQSELLGAIDHFPELARANVAAHVCLSQAAERETLHFLVAAWDDLNAQHLLSFINEMRTASGFPKVDEKQVKDALEDLQSWHAAAAAEGVWRSSAPGHLMNDVVEAELDRDPSTAFLRLFVQEYDSRSEPDLARIEADINHHLEEARKVDHTLTSHVDAICELLDAWDDVNQPVQLYEQHRGHEEGRSKRIYKSIRTVCIDLANDHEKFEDALRLSEALLNTFPELESVAVALKKDVDDLKSLTVSQAKQEVIKPLIKACEEVNLAKGNRLTLRKDLAKLGFSEKASGNLGKIARAFKQAIGNLEDQSTAFFVIRDLALNINNEQDDPETAFRLVDALLVEAGGRCPKEVVARLKEDRAVLHKNWKMGELNRQTGNVSAMSNTIEDLLEYAIGSDRTEILHLKSKIEQAKTRKKIKFGIFAAMAAAAVYFIYIEGGGAPSRSTYQSTSDSDSFSSNSSSYNSSSNSSSPQPSTNSTSSNNYAEEKPPVGTDRVLTRNQVRYCTFQGKRLDYMRPLTQSQREVDKFNRLIGDYNSRCSSFRYRQGTRSSLEREASSRASVLRAEARKTVSSW